MKQVPGITVIPDKKKSEPDPWQKRFMWWWDVEMFPKIIVVLAVIAALWVMWLVIRYNLFV